MPNANVSRRDTSALLARFGLKPIDLVNMMLAAAALGFSLYTFLQTREQEHQRELFGGYILGYTATQLELCEAGNMYVYAHCGHPVTNADFKSLNPILDSLLQIPVDWPPEQARKDIGFPSDAEGAPNIVTSTLIAHYDDQIVKNAFFIGSAVRSLLALSDDPATGRTSKQRTQYLALAAQVSKILHDSFRDLCGGLKPQVPSHGDVLDLNGCLQDQWASQPRPVATSSQ